MDNGKTTGFERTGQRRHAGRRPAEFYTIEDIAETLAVSPRTARRAIDAGLLVAHHFGRAVRISDLDFQAYVAAHKGR
jgi:excisionase family DNA binding protein